MNTGVDLQSKFLRFPLGIKKHAINICCLGLVASAGFVILLPSAEAQTACPCFDEADLDRLDNFSASEPIYDMAAAADDLASYSKFSHCALLDAGTANGQQRLYTSRTFIARWLERGSGYHKASYSLTAIARVIASPTGPNFSCGLRCVGGGTIADGCEFSGFPTDYYSEWVTITSTEFIACHNLLSTRPGANSFDCSVSD